MEDFGTVLDDSVYEIPQRIKEYDDSFFIVRNHKSQKFEVHSTDNLFNTYCFTVPYDELDSRTIDIAMKNDTKKKGFREIEREIVEHEEKMEKEKEKKARDWANDVARETYSAFKKDLDYEYIGMSRRGD